MSENARSMKRKVRKVSVSAKLLAAILFPAGTHIGLVEEGDTVGAFGRLTFYIEHDEFEPLGQVEDIPSVMIEAKRCRQGHDCCDGGVISKEFRTR